MTEPRKAFDVSDETPPRTAAETRALREAFAAGARWAGQHIPWPMALMWEEAEKLYPYATRDTYLSAEDPHCRGWYWRVKAGVLETNYVADDLEDMWEKYELQHTPGLGPTAERCIMWAKLFQAPVVKVPLE